MALKVRRRSEVGSAVLSETAGAGFRFELGLMSCIDGARPFRAVGLACRDRFEPWNSECDLGCTVMAAPEGQDQIERRRAHSGRMAGRNRRFRKLRSDRQTGKS